MEYRAENKYIVMEADLIALSSRLKTVMKMDEHQDGECYEIRSLYFDDIWDRCMMENDAGVDQRKKFRIRTYDPQGSVIHLEIKEKYRGFTKKTACNLSKDECLNIMNGNLPLILDKRKPLNQLRIKSRCEGMIPKAIIAYERTAFVYPTGNVRVTFDRNIMATEHLYSFFDTRMSGFVPVLPIGMHVLEVKYDEFLPDFIAEMLEIGNLNQTSFSKYYLGRMALQGSFQF